MPTYRLSLVCMAIIVLGGPTWTQDFPIPAPARTDLVDPYLLGRADIRAELRLDPATIAALEKLGSEAGREIKRAVGEAEPAHRAMNKILDRWSAAQASVLTPGQRERLGQIHLQNLGSYALLDPAIRERLGLSEEQSTRLKALADAPGDPVAPPRAVGRETALGILTPEQRDAWKKMLGAPFVFAPAPAVADARDVPPAPAMDLPDLTRMRFPDFFATPGWRLGLIGEPGVQGRVEARPAPGPTDSNRPIAGLRQAQCCPAQTSGRRDSREIGDGGRRRGALEVRRRVALPRPGTRVRANRPSARGPDGPGYPGLPGSLETDPRATPARGFPFMAYGESVELARRDGKRGLALLQVMELEGRKTAETFVGLLDSDQKKLWAALMDGEPAVTPR